MTTGPSRCIYALRPADRPGCQLTATVTYGGIALCSACDAQRSTLGKGQASRRLAGTEPDPIALLADARLHLIDAHEQLHAAVTRQNRQRLRDCGLHHGGLQRYGDRARPRPSVDDHIDTLPSYQPVQAALAR